MAAARRPCLLAALRETRCCRATADRLPPVMTAARTSARNLNVSPKYSAVRGSVSQRIRLEFRIRKLYRCAVRRGSLWRAWLQWKGQLPRTALLRVPYTPARAALLFLELLRIHTLPPPHAGVCFRSVPPCVVRTVTAVCLLLLLLPDMPPQFRVFLAKYPHFLAVLLFLAIRHKTIDFIIYFNFTATKHVS